MCVRELQITSSSTHRAAFSIYLDISMREEAYRLIGQNVLVKTAVMIEISIVIAVISFLKEDIGWTKRVGKNADIC